MTSPTSICSEDYDAAETFAAALMDQIDVESVANMVGVQRDMLSRFEKTNEMLINFNILSANRFAITSQQYRRHTQLMFEMKRDLDSIFKRIRVIKEKLAKSYPESFKVSGSTAPIFEDEEEVDDKIIGDVDVDMATDLSTLKVTTRNSTIQQDAENDVHAGAIASGPGLVKESVEVSGKVPEDVNKLAHVSESKCLSESGINEPEKSLVIN